MRLVSTPQSVKDGEVSLLAILETSVAVCLTLWIAFKCGTLAHIAVGGCLGFLLLLRTEASTQLGITWLIRVKNWLTESLSGFNTTKYPRSMLLSILFVLKVLALYVYILILYMLSSVLIKVSATCVTVRRFPGASLSQIPSNWFRVSLCIDSRRPPELVPGTEELKDVGFLEDLPLPIKFKNISSMVVLGILASLFAVYRKKLAGPTSIKSDTPPLVELTQLWLIALWALSLAVTFVLLFVPSLMYRCCLKSTSLLYLPLIWIVRAPSGTTATLDSVREYIRSSTMERVKRFYSWLVILVSCLPLAISMYWQHLLGAWTHGTVARYYFPTSMSTIASWHITRVAAAVITLLLYLFADPKADLLKPGRPEEPRRSSFLAALRARKLLTIWTIGCGLALIWSAVDWHTFPGIKWLPFR